MTFVSSAVQTSFDTTFYAGQAGVQYDFQTSTDGLELSVAASGSVAFGRGVACGTITPNIGAVPTNGTDAGRLRGIALADNRVASGSTGYADGTNVRLLQRGKCWVYSETAIVSDRSQAYVRITESTTGAGDQGQWRGDSDSGKAVSVAGCRFLTVNGSMGASGPVVLEVNLMPAGAAL